MAISAPQLKAVAGAQNHGRSQNKTALFNECSVRLELFEFHQRFRLLPE